MRGDGGGHEGVDAKARRHGEGVLGPEAHDDGEDTANEGGGRGNLGDAEGVACTVRTREDQRVQDNDVGHGEERGEAAADFARNGGTALRELEVAVQTTAGRGGGGAS